MRKLIIISALVGVLGACTTTEPVYLRHQKTGQVVQCGPYDGRPIQSSASAVREAQCINDYKEQGFVRIPKPGK